MRRAQVLLVPALLIASACQSAAPSAPPTPPPSAASSQPTTPQAAPSPAGAQPSAAPAGEAGSASNALSPEVQRLIAAARANGETELDFSWATDVVGGPDGAAQYQDLMSRMYGLTVKINYTPGPSMTTMAGKVAQEVAAGQTASTDILVGSELHYASMIQTGSLESYDYTQLSPRITQQILTPDDVGVEFESRLPDITYNTNLVPASEVPQTLQAVLDPKWKGKIASTTDAAGFDRVSTLPNWGPDMLKTYLTNLSQQVSGLIRCAEDNRVANGEFAMLVLDCGTFSVHQLAAKGAPIAGVIPLDAAIEAFSHMGVPKTAAHPNLAKLYVNAVLSEEGQKILYSMDYADETDLPGSQEATELADLRAHNVQPERVDVQFVLDHPDVAQLTQESITILQGTGS